MLGNRNPDGKIPGQGTGKTSDWTYPGLSKNRTGCIKRAVAVFVINPSTDSIATKPQNSARRPTFIIRAIPRTKGQLRGSEPCICRIGFGQPIDTIIKTSKAGGFIQQRSRFESKQSPFSLYRKTKHHQGHNVPGVLEGTDKRMSMFSLPHITITWEKEMARSIMVPMMMASTVAVMQLASAFAKAKEEGKGPRRNIVFMTVSGEEKGLWGSEIQRPPGISA